MCRWDRLWLVGFCALVLQRCFLENHCVQWWGEDISGSDCVLFLFSICLFKSWREVIPLLVNSGRIGITGHSIPLLTFPHILPPTLISNKNIQHVSNSPPLELAHLSSMLRCSLSPGVPPPTDPLVLSCARATVSREGRSYPGNCGRARGWAGRLAVSDLPPRMVRRHRDRGRAESGWGAGRASHLECKRVRGTAK